ncbi:MAG TPA: hypothetical protein VGO73_10860 [Pyrinomonadaceae bacterium]|jgi:hypothetical protein|nr:hypothetical protein [Pyrinomonadaceae bacterium]
MSVRNLKKKSVTDWARIDKMTDDKIDTSDIPPLDDKFFKSAKWLLPRWCIDLNDFRQAKEFAAHILKRKWQQDLNETPVRRLEHKAFNTSLIVSYARPFHNNKTLKGAPESSLRKQVVKVLNHAEIELHDRILRLRDTVVAHSDGRALQVFTSGSLTFMRVVENLSESEVMLLKRMTKKWIDYLEIESSNFKRRLALAVQGDSNSTVSVQSRVRAKR